jgi:hypothetical protein
MDITLAISVFPAGQSSVEDRQAAREWLAGEISRLTGLEVENFEGGQESVTPADEYEVTSIALLDD